VDDEVAGVGFVVGDIASSRSGGLSESALARFIMRNTVFVVSLSKERPKRDISVAPTW